MPRASPAQVSFNAGIFSPNLEGRIDLDKYRSACSVMRNFLPLIAGAAKKRSGTRFVREVKDSAAFTRVVAFEFGTTQAYILEFGDEYMRVYRDGGIVLDGAGPSVFELATPYATADLDGLYFAQSADILYVAHPDYAPRKISRTDHDAWTITEIDFDWRPFQPENSDVEEGFSVSAVTGSSVTITSGGGRLTSDMVGGHVKLREIVPSNHGKWESASANTDYSGSFSAGETRYWEENVYELQTGSGNTGTSPPIHENGIKSDGKRLWEYLHSGSGYVRITAVTDAFRATGTVVKRLPESVIFADQSITAITKADPAEVTSSSHGLEHGDRVYIQGVGGMTELNQRQFTVTKVDDDKFTLDDEDSSGHTTYTSGGIVVRTTHRWALGAWSDENGYPRCVAFYEDRLTWAGSKANPQTLWLSRTGDYENHRQSDEDESGLIFTLNTDQVNVIEWISPGEELAIGTAGGEFTLGAARQGDPLTAGNVRAPRRGSRGSKANVQPIRVGEQVLFVQRSGRKLLEFVFNFDIDGFQAIDLAVLADIVPEPGIRKMGFQKEPHRILWLVLDNGELVALSYEREQQVTGWHRHPLGGTDVEVESVAVIPHPDGDQDQVWLTVKRTIDGGTKRYIEFIEKDWLEQYDQEDAFFVDCGLTYDGAAATTISGLDHLEGQTVKVLADGAAHPDRTVASGEIELQQSASVVQVGLGYVGALQTMRFEAGSGDGTAQGKTKRIHRLVVRLYQCGGAFHYGHDPDDSSSLVQKEIRTAADDLSAAVPLFDGDSERLNFPPLYEQEGRVAFLHDLPLPCTLIAIFPQLATQDGG